tara:strand:+ start:858 stop:1247 length:390 start_codon:yes stop_codon:yes gene_type:complete
MDNYFEINNFSNDDLDRFINFSQDSSKIHSSYDYAISLGFEDRVCHGIMSLTPISRILGMILPGEGYIILEIKSKFHNPVYPNHSIEYNYKIISKNESLGIVCLEIKLLDKNGTMVSTTTAICKKVEPK